MSEDLGLVVATIKLSTSGLAAGLATCVNMHVPCSPLCSIWDAESVGGGNSSWVGGKSGGRGGGLYSPVKAPLSLGSTVIVLRTVVIRSGADLQDEQQGAYWIDRACC